MAITVASAPDGLCLVLRFLNASSLYLVLHGGAPRVPPLRHQFPSGGPVGHPHALPSGMSRASNTTTQTPSGRGSRAALPGPLGPALVLRTVPPPPPSLVATGGCARTAWPCVPCMRTAWM
eukprot:scaffold86126_cov32-Tisochrysis_lutea.AAC.4